MRAVTVWRTAGLAGLALALATACSVNVDYAGTQFQCDATGACPSGFECRAGSCVPIGTPADDASPGSIDASPGAVDATSIDAGAPDASVPLSCASVGKLVDDFDDGVTGPLWGDGFANTGTERLEQDGQLVLRVAAGAGDAWAGNYSRYPHDLTSHYVQVRVDQVGPQYTVLELRRPDGARVQLFENGGALKAAVYGTDDEGVRAEQSYAPGGHRWWRIREYGGVLYWEVSANGNSWTAMHQEANPFPPRMLRIYLAAGGAVDADAEARFDDLNPNGDPTVPWCALATFSDDFDDGARAAEWAHSWQNTGCVLAETDGNLALQFDGTPSSWCAYESWPVYDACSSHAAVEIPTPLAVASAEMWFVVFLPNGRLSIEQWDGTLRLLEYAGSDVAESFTLPYDVTAHRWWRVRTDGTSAHWETAPDGATWTTHVSRPLALDCSAGYVGLGGGLWDTWTAGAIEARFDNFNVAP